MKQNKILWTIEHITTLAITIYIKKRQEKILKFTGNSHYLNHPPDSFEL